MSRFMFTVVGPTLGVLAIMIAAIYASYKAVDRALGTMKW